MDNTLLWSISARQFSLLWAPGMVLVLGFFGLLIVFLYRDQLELKLRLWPMPLSRGEVVKQRLAILLSSALFWCACIITSLLMVAGQVTALKGHRLLEDTGLNRLFVEIYATTPDKLNVTRSVSSQYLTLELKGDYVSEGVTGQWPMKERSLQVDEDQFSATINALRSEDTLRRIEAQTEKARVILALNFLFIVVVVPTLFLLFYRFPLWTWKLDRMYANSLR